MPAVRRAIALLGDGLMGVVLFGSWARGAAADSSDVDVLVVVDPNVALTRDLYRQWDAAPVTWEDRPVEPHFVHAVDAGAVTGGVWAEAALDGIVVFERRFDVSMRLARVRHEILSGRLVRRVAHGQPYWSDPTSADYGQRAELRVRAIQVLFDGGGWADVVRESQEVVELALKGLLRACGIEAPRIHDVSEILLAEHARLPAAVRPEAERLAAISRGLRRDRELAFYGAEDLTPSTFYSKDDATTAFDGARFVVSVVAPAVRTTP